MEALERNLDDNVINMVPDTTENLNQVNDTTENIKSERVIIPESCNNVETQEGTINSTTENINNIDIENELTFDLTKPINDEHLNLNIVKASPESVSNNVNEEKPLNYELNLKEESEKTDEPTGSYQVEDKIEEINSTVLSDDTEKENSNNEKAQDTNQKVNNDKSHHQKHSSSHRLDRKDESTSKSSHKSRSHRHESSSRSSSRRHRLENRRIQCNAEDITYEEYRNKTYLVPPTRVPWRPHPLIAKLRYRRHYRVVEDENGGALVAHLYCDELKYMTRQQLEECALEFIKLSYSEDEQKCAYFVIGVVHNAADYLPDLVDYMADHYPSLTVKMGSLGGRDSHSTTMAEYRHQVYRTYWNGTFRFAPLDELSLCGVSGEEAGAYFPDFVARLENSPFMKPVMPWSDLSVVHTDNPRESNDGPIFWVRPGEQMIPANEALKDGSKSKKRRNNELDNLVVGLSRISDIRESLFMDRTRPHADQIGVDGEATNTAPTAAVGVLKCVLCGHKDQVGRAAKDVIAFDAKDYDHVVSDLKLDLYEPPQTQCTKWLEVAKLNSMRREGIRYVHLQLHDGDVYYLPRKVVHQFQTISAVASIAWHHRYKEYFREGGAPNLHTPTGLNKGQVFYELSVVSEYKFQSAECVSDGGRSDSRSRSPSPSNRSAANSNVDANSLNSKPSKDKVSSIKKLAIKKPPSPYKKELPSVTKVLSTPTKNTDKSDNHSEKTPVKAEKPNHNSDSAKKDNNATCGEDEAKLESNNTTPAKRRLSEDSKKPCSVSVGSNALSTPASAKKRRVTKPPNPDVLGAIFAEMEQKKHLFD